MAIHERAYRHPDDYAPIGDFLVRSFPATAEGPHRNWLQPRWEYAHYHPMLDAEHLDRWGVWEDDGRIVAVVHDEHVMGLVYVQLDPAYPELKPELLEHAAARLGCAFDRGPAVCVYLDDDDKRFQEAATELGYVRLPSARAEVTSTLSVDDLPLENPVPHGFELLGLDEDDDLHKVHRVMHRGFDHPGEPPADGLAWRRRKLAAPNLRKDLTVVARAPNGDFASLCGMWLDAENGVSYVEPVATDPAYRRRGLGTAVVLEGVRRCAREGARVAYVGTDKPFYLSMGFEPRFRYGLWRKPLEAA